MPTPAEMLVGLTVQGKARNWTVISECDKSNQGSGGHFSKSYIVEDSDGTPAFLKAMDYAEAFAAPDQIVALQELTASFDFERTVLRICVEKNLDRIVRILDEGLIEIQNSTDHRVPPFVNFLVFELAEGDVRSQIDKMKKLDVSICLNILHDAAVGLQQLHGAGIAHQDLRPSNILQFKSLIAKLADLGRAASRDHSAPHDELYVPGCLSYAPPEFLYRMDREPGIHEWRRGGDLFLLGSMVFFMFAGKMLMPVLVLHLAPEHHFNKWTGTYEQILPYLRKAFANTCSDFENSLPSEIRARLSPAMTQLCEPDPRQRGHPLNHSAQSDKYSLERYIALFDHLAKRTEIMLRR